MSDGKKVGLGFKIAIGCAVGCGLMAVLVGAAVVGSAYWVLTPGQQVETAGIIGSDAVAVARIDRTTEDPGVRAAVGRFFTAAMRQQQQTQREELPENLRWMHDLGSSQSQPGMLNMYVPKSVTMAIEPGEVDGEPEIVVALNLRAFGRLFRMMLESEDGSAIPYRGHTIEPVGDDFFVSFVKGTLMLGSELGTLQRAIDRAESETPAAPPNALLQPEAGADWDLWLAAIDHDGGLGELVADVLTPREEEGWDGEEWDDEPSEEEPELEGADALLVELPPDMADSLARVAVGIDVRSDDHLVAEVVFHAESAEAAERWLGRLDGALEAKVDELPAGRRPSLEIQRTVDGGRAVAEIELSGLGAWIDAAAADLLAGEEF